MENKQTLISIYANPLTETNASRLEKILKTLGKSGIFDKTYILCEHQDHQKKAVELFPNVFTKRIPSPFKQKGPLFTSLVNSMHWLFRIILWSLFKKIHTVNFIGPLELVLLPYFKILKKSNIYYYANDIPTQNRIGGIKESVYSFIESVFLKYCDGIIVVSDGIKKWYEKEYNISNVHTIWTALLDRELINSHKNKFEIESISDDSLVFGYIGTFNTGRSLENLLEIFTNIDENKHLVLGGYGELEELIKRKAKNNKNIHYIGPIPWGKIISFTNTIDIGLVMLENVSLNYYYALPTKFFEYLATGNPVIASNFPDMGGIVDRYNSGWKVNPTKKELQELIKNISRENYDTKKNNATKNKNLFTWPKQKSNLLKIYEKN